MLQGHKSAILSLIFHASQAESDTESDDGTVSIHPNDRVITGSMDCTARSWSLDLGKCLKVSLPEMLR